MEPSRKIERRSGRSFFGLAAIILVVGALVAVALPVMVAAFWGGDGIVSDATASNRR